MKRIAKTKFYEFTQNNSGGFFDVNENVCHRVIIEAVSSKQAEEIFEPMIENQSSSCPCCGERWSSYSPDEIKIDNFKEKGYPVRVFSFREGDHTEERWFELYGDFPRLSEPEWRKSGSRNREFGGAIYFKSIEQYCQFLANEYGWTKPDVRIHYLNGDKKEIFSSRIPK